ncbi:MAG: hypothetical protein GQ549_01355, partial [Gammaproteobacteria bacterium]|nr:hypothetical protein [Gammaproteobacteria bacterium]
MFILQACSETSTNKLSDDEEDTSGGEIPLAILCDPDAVVSSFSPVTALAVTVAADYGSGAHALISGDNKGQFVSLNDLDATDSDITIAIYGEHFYRIGRQFAGNSITKYAIANPGALIWQRSVNDPMSAVASNPADMIFVSETKAYVLQYNKTKAWIVNPSAATEAGFKIGEIDLSAYGGIDGIPEMHGGVIVDNKLFITLERLEGASKQPDNVSYLAVIDVTTDLEIDVGIDGDAFKGIPLQARNPTQILYDETSNQIYVLGSGSTLPPLKYVGGIETIDATNYVSNFILDDGDDEEHPYGIIYQMALVTSDLLYFVG